MKHLITTICLLAVTAGFVTTDECQAGSRKQQKGSSRFQRSSGKGGSRFGTGRQPKSWGGNQSFGSGRNSKNRFTRNFTNGNQNRDGKNSGFRRNDNRDPLGKFQKNHRGSGSLRRLLVHSNSHKHNRRPWFRSQRRHQHANHWCFERPAYCHWWFDYCTPLVRYRRTDIVHCDFVRCKVPYVMLAEGNVVNNAIWYLGVKGMILPQSGLGIDEVEPGSPAAQAGLTAGMVIISCNDIQITSESDMQKAIATSGGVLRVLVQLEDGSQAQGVVQMAQAPAVTI